MTVEVLVSEISYTENGVTTAFAVPFQFHKPAHIHVERVAPDGEITTLVYGTDYSATGGSGDDGGVVNVVAPAISGTRLNIWRNTPRQQETDYATADRFPAETHEHALDRDMLIEQEQDRDLTNTQERAVMVGAGETAPLLDMTGIADGDLLEARGGVLQKKDMTAAAGLYAAFDGHGELIGVAGGLPDGVPAQAQYIAVDGGGNVQEAMYYITPEMSGAAGDGATDDTTAIQNAISSAVGTSRPLYVRGSYRLTSPVNILSNLNMRGPGRFIINHSGSAFRSAPGQTTARVSGMHFGHPWHDWPANRGIVTGHLLHGQWSVSAPYWSRSASSTVQACQADIGRRLESPFNWIL
ncbi:MAG: glycosyl hydrolase family 28-related protein [Sphingomonadaceae bacterium]